MESLPQGETMKTTTKTITMATSINPMTARLMKALTNNGLTLVEVVLLTDDQILALKGVGPALLTFIRTTPSTVSTGTVAQVRSKSGSASTSVRVDTVVRSAAPSKELALALTRPARNNEWVSVIDLEAIRLNLMEAEAVQSVLSNPKADKDVVEITRMFIAREINYQPLVNILNNNYALDEHMNVEIGKLSCKLVLPGASKYETFDAEKMKAILASTLLHGLVDINKIPMEVKDIREVNQETGKVLWRKQSFISFGYTPTEEEIYMKGIHMEPTVVQKKTKVKVGGQSVKLSGGEKMFLKNVSKQKLRLVATPEEIIVEYFKGSAWYKEAALGKGNMDVIIADELIKKYTKGILMLQKLEGFHLSLWMDYRTRLYYDCIWMGINPHGKTFETSQYELAEARFITLDGFNALAYNAVAITDGRIGHSKAIAKFTENKDHYLGLLKSKEIYEKESDGSPKLNHKGDKVRDLGKIVYNTRLAEAIEDYYSETASHFLLSEDATNGGLQHGGIGFKSPKMMYASNVGASTSQEDSHGNLRRILGLNTRTEAKDIHQPLLHGSSLRTVAKVMDKSLAETKMLLEDAYGKEVFNIEKIADWGTKAVDNNNTSLRWTTMDGFKAQSIAYTESVPLTIYAMSSVNKSGYSTTTVNRDMPIKFDGRGEAIYGKTGNGQDDKRFGGSIKVRGLYANITHSVDASVLREVARALIQVESAAMFKHDNFLVHANDMSIVRASYKTGLLRAYDFSAYESAMRDVVMNFKGTNKPPVPVLTIGTASAQLIEDSHYYLAA